MIRSIGVGGGRESINHIPCTRIDCQTHLVVILLLSKFADCIPSTTLSDFGVGYIRPCDPTANPRVFPPSLMKLNASFSKPSGCLPQEHTPPYVRTIRPTVQRSPKGAGHEQVTLLSMVGRQVQFSSLIHFTDTGTTTMELGRTSGFSSKIGRGQQGQWSRMAQRTDMDGATFRRVDIEPSPVLVSLFAVHW